MDIQRIKSVAVDTMLIYGEIPGGTFVVEGTEGMVDVIVPVPDVVDRHRYIRQIGRRVRRRHGSKIGELRFVGMMSEAWMAQADSDEEPAVRPSQNPDRVEVVVATVYDVRRNQSQITLMEIKRDGDTIELVEIEEAWTAVESPIVHAFVQGFTGAGQVRS